MQWHTPMGYSVRDGRIIVNGEQCKVVQKIFKDYDKGAALQAIAEELKKREVLNAQDRVKWTHATVGRILQNYNYLGTEFYPQIVDKELFDRVQQKREQKSKERCKGKYRPDRKERLLFSGILVCGECGQTYSHYQPKNRKTRKGVAKWKCKNYLYQNRVFCKGGFITDNEVMDVCVEAINRIIEDVGIIQVADNIPDIVTIRFQELDQKILRNQYELQENMLTLLYERAAERFKTLEVKDFEQITNEMTDILAEKEKLEHFDEQLYRKLIKQIVVHKDSTVKVIFRNGSSTKVRYGKETQEI